MTMPASPPPAASNRPTVVVLLAPAMRRKILSPAAEAALAQLAEVRSVGEGELLPERLPALLAGARACVTGWGTPPLTEEVLAGSPKLGLVAHTAGSIRRLVPPEAIENGLLVSHAAIHIAEAVAEYTIAQILLHLRQPHRHDAGMKEGAPWLELRATYLGSLLGARTVGIIGAGYVGRLVISLLRPFGCRILVADPLLTAARAAELGVEPVDLATLLETSDIVSLHAPVLPETRGMIGAAELAKLRDGTFIINTARSILVDQAALLAELETGRIDAMLDVFDEEPLPLDDPFRRLPNVTLAPHAAGHTADTYHRQGSSMIAEIGRFLAGEPLRHQVTPAMLRTMA
jgi:phosphoglycerate dehydrogenase-like enzyme